MPSAASGYIQATPQHVGPGDVMTVTITYVPPVPANGVVPNDAHIEFQKTGESAWTAGSDSNVAASETPTTGIDRKFNAPTDPGTYDIRVRWTVNGETIATSRVGQFFVDKPKKKKPYKGAGWAAGATVGGIAGTAAGVVLGAPLGLPGALAGGLAGWVIGTSIGALIGGVIDWLLSD